jgi:hypothetical protein
MNNQTVGKLNGAIRLLCLLAIALIALSVLRMQPEEGKKEMIIRENPVYELQTENFGIDTQGGDARTTTDGINNALLWAKDNGYKTVAFPKGTYLIQCNWNNRYIAPTDGILVPSGLTLDLGEAVFKIEPNAYPAYAIFSVVGQSDVGIMGGTLIGDRYQHQYVQSEDSPTHEWGFGICVSASSNVVIQGVSIRDMTGDGIILEGSYQSLADGGSFSSEVQIYRCDIRSCRRQGISVIGIHNGEIARNSIYNIGGTEPAYGIDVETEFDYSTEGLRIHDNVIFACTGGAISCNNGADYKVYDNFCMDGNIIAVKSRNVMIYDNTVSNSYIRIYGKAQDIYLEDNLMQLYSPIIRDQQ